MDTQSRYFKAIRKGLYAGIAMAIATLSVMSSGVYADDTDVFLGTAQPGDDNIRPNILFILDTSGSMEYEDIADAPGKSRLDVMKEAMQGLLGSINNVNVGLMTFNSEGGPVRYPIGFIDADADLVEAGGFNINKLVERSSDDAEENINTLINPGQTEANDPYLHITEAVGSANPTVITINTISDADDVEETQSNGAMSTTSGSLDAHSSIDIGMRFRSINVPVGATIISAELILTVDPDGVNNTTGVDNEYSTAHFIISGQAADSATAFTSGNWNLTNRVRTLQSQAWNNVPAAEDNQTITSPNLSLIIQEIVSRPGWISGNNIALFLRTLNGYRDFESCRDSCPTRAPKLRISYTMDTTRIQKLVGLRFNEVRIPQGAEIRRAFLDFSAAATSAEPTRFIIRGENVADSTTFVEAATNISSRPVTGNGVVWTLDATEDWQANQRYETPDIAAVIQEIVNRPDWCGGQNLSLILEPASNATRLIKSFDGASAIVDAPGLRVEFDTDTQNISAPNTGCIINDVTARVSNSFDDAEERVSNFTTTATSNSLELIRDSGNNQHVGVRFRSLNIPQSAQILAARVEFTADGTSTGGSSLTIRGHKIADSPAFASGTGNKNISNRINNAPTGASVTWTPPDWNIDNQVHSSPDIRAVIQEIVNQAGWAAGNNLSLLISGSGTRRASSFDGNASQAARLVVTLKQSLAGVPSVSTQTVRERLIQEVSGLRTVAGTPTVNVYREALRYFRGEQAYWGWRRGGQYSNDRYSRLSHPATYTKGILDRPAGCSELDLNDLDCVDEIVDNGPIYKSPIVDACQANYIVLLSDGFQNTFYNTDGIFSLLDSAPDPFPFNCNVANGGEQCGLLLAEFANKFDQRPDLEGVQKITTFTIGFAISTQMLKDMGPRGGGQYKNANNSAELINAFDAFLGDILSRPTTFTAPTLTISAFNRLFNSNEIYISLFEPERTASWSGNVKKYFLCTPAQDEAGECTVGQLTDVNGADAAENGQIVTGAESDWGGFEDGPTVELGGAGAKVPDYADATRRVYTQTGTNPSLIAPENQVQNINNTLTATMLGVGSAAERTTLIQWIRGQDVDDEDVDGATNDQRWAFGDPLHSAAVTVNYGISAGNVPITKLFVGTNDGGFRMINTETGVEEWVFIPQELLALQKDLRDNPNGDHFYGMDGSPVAWINDNDGDSRIEPTFDPLTNDFVKMFIGQRRGGDNYYALDVSPTNTITTANTVGGVEPELLWKINSTTAGYSRLGQSWSKPFITSILVNEGGTTIRKNVLIFAGGYDPVHDTSFGTVNTLGNAIYIADAATGARIWGASGTAGDAGTLLVPDMKYSIPSDVRLIDMDGDGATDRLYVGDMAGQVWRVDLTGPLTAGSTANSVVGKLASLSNMSTTTPVLADQRRIMFRPEVALISDKEFANGTYVAVALTTGNREDPLSEDVHDRMYVLRDYTLGNMPDGNGDHLADPSGTPNFPTIVHGANLVDVTADIQTANAAALKVPAVGGWYVEFKEASGADIYVGEKGITEGQILISSRTEDPPVFTFNTYIPGLTTQSSACSVALGSNRTYFVNLLNGTGTDIIDDVSSRSKVNESYGIASDIIVIQQHGQKDVSVGGGTTDPTNTDLGDSLLPIYIME